MTTRGRATEKNSPELYDHLRRLMGKLAKESPGSLGAFGQPHRKFLAEGALNTKVKPLMANVGGAQ